jgi:hypothetical protein
MAGIEGSGGITPSDRKMYEQEYKQGAELFQRALNRHAKSDDIYQKQEFKEVMDEAMKVLNQTARGLKAQHLMTQNQQIKQDYSAYKKTGSSTAKSKLDEDLDNAKKSI